MSQPDDVPELSPEARAFLDRHATTGEPSSEALARARARLLSSAPASTAPPALAVLPPAPMRRSWLRHEVMAAAAVLVVVVGGQGLYLAYHSHNARDESAERAQTGTAEVKAVVAAYREGDVEGAQRLASQSCNDAACGPLSSSLAQVVGLSKRLDTLSASELDQLATLDAQLAQGSPTPLSRRVEDLRKPQLAMAEALFKAASEMRKKRDYEGAALTLEKCILVARGYHPCYRLLGSVYASIAARDMSSADMEEARHYYEQFLLYAPPDDEYAPKVRAILEAAADEQHPAPSVSPDSLVPVVVTVDDIAANTVVTMAMISQHSIPQRLVSSSLITPDSAHLIVNRKLLVPVKAGEQLSWAQFEASKPVVPQEHSEQDSAAIFLKASEAKRTGNWIRAVEFARQTLQIDPNHQGALRILLDAAAQAREVYLRGYQLRDSNPKEAVRLFKNVMELTSPDDDNHQKAQSRVNELEANAADQVDPSDAEDPPDVVLRVGRTRDVVFEENLVRAAVGDPEIADVQVVGPRTLRVKGVGKGMTTLLGWLSSGKRQSKLIQVR